MGKAAEKRKQNRITFLSNLLEHDPARFDIEWERRLAGWIHEIKSSTRKDGNTNEESVFHIVDTAMGILSACGEKALLLYGNRTKDLLENLCCRELSRHLGYELYKVTGVWPEGPFTNNHKRTRKGGPGRR